MQRRKARHHSRAGTGALRHQLQQGPVVRDKAFGTVLRGHIVDAQCRNQHIRRAWGMRCQQPQRLAGSHPRLGDQLPLHRARRRAGNQLRRLVGQRLMLPIDPHARRR